MQDDVDTLVHALELKDEGPLSVPVQGQVSTPAVPKSIFEHLESARLRALLQKRDDENAGRPPYE